MLKFIHIADIGGNIEGLFWVLAFIGWVIFQMTKAAKKAIKTTPNQNVSKPYTAPEEDIRKFLEGLGVQAGGRPSPPAVHDQQVRRKPASGSRHTMAPKPRVRTAPPPVPPAIQTITASRPLIRKLQESPVTVPQTHDIEDYHAKAYEIGKVHHVQLTELISDLKNVDAIRKAILLREILGPPIALR